MIIKIGARSYQMVGLNTLGDELSASQLLALRRQIVTHQHLTGIKDLKGLDAAVSELFAEAARMGTAPDVEGHPEGEFLSAVALWATRTKAGEVLTLAEAIDLPAGEVVELIPEDEHEGKALAEVGDSMTSPRPESPTSTR